MAHKEYIVIKIKYFTLSLGVFLLSGCIHPDYSPTIKEVATPLRSNLKAFYQQYKRFPNDAERDALLEKSGCKVKNNRCYYRGYSFLIESELAHGYRITLKLEGSDCMTGLLKDGTIRPVGCQDLGYLNFSH